MVSWRGKYYDVVLGDYNGKIAGTLLEGTYSPTRLPRTIVHGHICTPDGVLLVLRRPHNKILWGTICAGLLCALLMHTSSQVEYFQVCFAETPIMENGVLYCNIWNPDDLDVYVVFRSQEHTTAPYVVEAGDYLPYVHLDFVPTELIYNSEFIYSLEVFHD